MITWPLFVIRIVAIAVWTFVLHGIIRFCQVFHIAGLHKRRPGRLIGLWGKGLTRIMGIKVHKVNELSGPLADLCEIATHFHADGIMIHSYPKIGIPADIVKLQ